MSRILGLLPLSLLVAAGCSHSSGTCASVACPTGGKTYEVCTSGTTQTWKLDGQSCGCDTAAGVACTQTCATQVVAYCGGPGTDGGNPDGPVSMVTGTNHSQLATNNLTLPTTSAQYAIDLNGDGQPDNALGKIVASFTTTGLMPQMAVTAAVTAGSDTYLIEEQSSDPTQQSAAGAGVTLALATRPASPPKYDGTDTFTVSSSDTPSQFLGNISNGVFTSNDPATATAPVQVTLSLSFIAGQPPLILPVTAGYVQLTNTNGVVSGQIDGAIKQTDVNITLLPAFAQLMNTEYNDPSTPAQTRQTLATFDTDDNGMITVAELMNNPIIESVFAADVQLFQNGAYAPNPANTAKDSLSLGLAFTAVKASF
jgi:hypothetical protein